MKRLSQLTAIVMLAALTAAPVLADTLVLKSGERVSGYFEGGSARVVKFRSADGVVKDYDILSVQTIQFGESSTPSTSASAPTTTPSTPAASTAPNRLPPANSSTGPDPRLRPSADRPPAQ